jgi:hypothetical protein
VDVAAVAWAYDQVDLPSPIAKVILLIYAIHANSRGYSWPSTETIAFVCCTDRRTEFWSLRFRQLHSSRRLECSGVAGRAC